jgi:two-component system cell cycle sensor histidine kinase/response regulator CckA
MHHHPGDRPSLATTLASALLHVGLAAVAYFASARVGYLLHAPHGVITLWPPAGVMLALLLLSARADWPALAIGGLVGCMLSDAMSHASVGFTIAAGVANIVESMVAALWLRHRLGTRICLGSLREVGEFLAGAILITNACTAVLGAVVLHRGVGMPFGLAWFVWFVGDGLGMLVVAPVILTCVGWMRERPLVRLATVVEAALMFAALIGVLELTLRYAEAGSFQPGLYLTFPLLFWAAIRFGPRGASVAALVVTVYTAWHTALGIGPFSAASSALNVAVQMYIYLGVMSLSSLIPAAVLEERKASALRQHETEERYRTVVEAATDAIITMDEHGTILFANPAAERVFGYSGAELVGQNLTMLMPERYRTQHHGGLERYLTTGVRNIPWQFVALTGLHREGREIPLEVSFGERTQGSKHIFTGILRDISERRAAEQALLATEERMRFALEASRVGLWEVDIATGKQRWSVMHEQLHGLAAGAFGGSYQAFLDVIHPADRQAVIRELERSKRQQNDANILYRTILPDGTTRWISGVGRIFFDDEGNPLRAAGIALDVTERRVLEEQYRQSQKMDAIGQLAGGVAHDFNNLLTAILAYGRLLEESLTPGSAQHDDLLEIIRAGERAASLTRQLLTFSRQQIVTPRPLSFAGVLRSIEPMLRRLIGEHIDFRVNTTDDPGTIVADEGQLEQIILNLALNARDAMPNGGTLVLDIRHVDVLESSETPDGPRAGHHAVLSVSDTGIGMDALTLGRIFEPFFTTKEPGKGTGLGLSTVYGIVRQSDGAITVESAPGRGSTFKVYQRCIDAPCDASAPEPPNQRHHATETVLVTEDDAALRRLTQRILEKSGYSVLLAATPSEALALIDARTERPDLLLTDIVLPEMNGRLLAEEAVRRVPALRVLYMSGYTDDALVHRDARDTHFIQKPFTQGQLLDKVRGVLSADTHELVVG